MAHRLFLVLALFIVSSVAHAAISWSLPATSSTGSYTITWSGGQMWVEVWENVNGTWLKQSQNAPSGSWAVSGKPSGTYTYKLYDCMQNQYGISCAQTSPSSITVTLVAPAPAAPSSVTASASGTSVVISWPGVSGATSYNVFRANSQIGTSAGTSYTDNTVVAGNNYTYQVQACNSNGCSASTSSNAVNISVPPPAAPASVSLSSVNGYASISWTAVSGVSYYTVQQVGSSLTSTTTLTSTTDGNVAAGVTYTYQVNACNNSSCSAFTRSNAVTIVAPLPSTPTGLVASASGSSIWVRWLTSSGATSYTLYKSGGGTSSTISGVTSNSYTDGSVAPGTTYTYAVAACNASGCSAASGGASAAAAIPVPAVPSGLSATAGNTTVGLQWNAVSYATYYTLQRNPTGTGFPTGAITSTSYTDTGLSPGAAYSYNVQACNGSGCSAWSSQVSATTVALPAAPAYLSAAQSGATIVLSWPAASNATQYKLTRTNGSTVATWPLISATSVSDTNVAVDTDYVYQVQACNSVGCSSGSATSATIRVAHIPAAPTSVSAVVRQNGIYVSWTSNDNATSFKLNRNGSQISSAAVAPYADTSVVNGTSYTYGVSACNSTGCSSVASASPVVGGAVQAGGNVVENYEYNVLGRLVNVKENGATKTQYDYDNAGNRKQVTE